MGYLITQIVFWLAMASALGFAIGFIIRGHSANKKIANLASALRESQTDARALRKRCKALESGELGNAVTIAPKSADPVPVKSASAAKAPDDVSQNQKAEKPAPNLAAKPDKPAAIKPAATKAVAEKPVAEKPVTKKTVAKKTVAKKAAVKKAVVKKAVSKKKTAKKPAKKKAAPRKISIKKVVE